MPADERRLHRRRFLAQSAAVAALGGAVEVEVLEELACGDDDAEDDAAFEGLDAELCDASLQVSPAPCEVAAARFYIIRAPACARGADVSRA